MAIVLLLANVIRNYIILDNLKSKIQKISQVESFSYTIEQGDVKQKITKIENIAKIENNIDNNIMYFNLSNGDMIRENTENGAILYNPEIHISVELNLLNLEDRDGDFWEFCLKNIITTKEINGIKCYKIKDFSLSTTYYVSVENGLTMATISDDKEIGDTGDTTYYQYEFDNLEKVDFETLKLLAESGASLPFSNEEMQYYSYQGEKTGDEVVELLNKVTLNAFDNEKNNEKLPDIIYLDESDSVKTSGLTNILDLTDEDINHILEAEVFASNDGLFEFQYNKDYSFRIASNAENLNQEAISDLISQIELEDQYYIEFYNNWSNNGVLEAIIVSHLN